MSEDLLQFQSTLNGEYPKMDSTSTLENPFTNSHLNDSMIEKNHHSNENGTTSNNSQENTEINDNNENSDAKASHNIMHHTTNNNTSNITNTTNENNGQCPASNTSGFVLSDHLVPSFVPPADDIDRQHLDLTRTNTDLIDRDTVAAVAATAAATVSINHISENGNKRGYPELADGTADTTSHKKQQMDPTVGSVDDSLNDFNNTNAETLHMQDSLNQNVGQQDSSTSINPQKGNVLDLTSKSKIIKFTPNRTSENIKKPHLYLTNPNSKKNRRESTKGPPKNSRFFKVYNVDGSKPSKPSSIHHYNPYRYPQNRSKLNPHPDFIKSKREDPTPAQIATIAGLSVSPDQNNDLTSALPNELLDPIPKYTNLSIPELTPTMDEFEDIYSYIESIKEIGEKYGAVKIRPPKEFSPKFSINLESFWIKSNRQLWRSPSDELNTRCEFYRQLKDALATQNVSINKLPCIDKRVIDLYRLYRVVNIRGGFENCCNDKLWAQIGRELGFYGKISSSLSSSIKSVYQKYITPWEILNKDNQNQDFLNLARNDESRCLFSHDEFLKKSSDLPIILGSSTPFQRNRQTLLDAGFSTYFDQATTQKKGITLSDNQTLPNYNFYNWSDSTCVDDALPTELKISSLYTLKQFYDKSRILKTQLLNKFKEAEHYKFENLNYLENTFWDLLENKNIMFETEVSLDQSTTIHDSSCENKFLSDKNGNLSDTILGSLNFNNTTISDGSMLQYIDSDSATTYHSYLNFCMFYGSKSWSIEDHWLYNIDYHYLGDAKSFYVIPPEYQEKYEELLKTNLESRNKENERTSQTLKLFEKEIINYDIYNACLENQVCYDINLPRSRPNDVRFEKLVENESTPIRFNTDIMFSPKYLKENGIPVYHTFQEVGDMIIKFPKSYSSYFSLGTSVTESINIAGVDWLKYSLQVSKWFQKQQLIPRFSTFSMYLAAARTAKDQRILKLIKPTVEELVREEIYKRTEIRKLMTEVTFNEDYKIVNDLSQVQREISNIIINDTDNETVGTKLASKLGNWNKVTDADLADIFPTFILVRHITNKQSVFTMSIDCYKEKYQTEAFQAMNYECKMISLVTDDYLLETVNILNEKLGSADEWIKKYHDILSKTGKPYLKDVLRIFELGKAIFFENNIRYYEDEETIYKQAFNEYLNLKAEINKTQGWAKKAKWFLNFSVENNNQLLPFNELKSLVDEIKDLNILTEEIEGIIVIAKETSEFDQLATLALNKDVKDIDMEELKKLQSIGSESKVEIESFKLIDKIVKRSDWLELLTSKLETPKALEEVYLKGKELESNNADDIELLNKFEEMHIKCEKVYSKYEKLKDDEEKVSLEDLVELDAQCNDLPLHDAKRYIKSLITEHEHITEMVLPILKTVEEKVEKVRNENDFAKRIEIFLKYSDIIGRKMSNINIEFTSKALSKFKEFEAASKLFKEQLIDGPKTIYKEINEKFKKLLTFGKDEFKFNNMSESDCLNYLVSYDMDILNSDEERYCVCRQLHEGNMVECERCKQWFHFNCIGYTGGNGSGGNGNGGGHGGGGSSDDNNKYLCPLCDIDNKFPTTRKFYTDVSKKTTLDQILAFSNTLIDQCSISILYENTFLQITLKYYDYYDQLVHSSGIAHEVLPDESSTAPGSGDASDPDHASGRLVILEDDVGKLRKLLQKVDGCVINFDRFQRVLRNKYYSRCHTVEGRMDEDVGEGTDATTSDQRLWVRYIR